MPLQTLIKNLFATTLLLLSINGISQKPLPRIIEASEFLNKKMQFSVYDIETDSLGYIYCAGSSNVLRFNGIELVELKNENDNYKTLTVSFHKDFFDRIWVVYQNGLINYIELNEVLDYPFPDTLRKALNNKISNVYRDSLKNLHISGAHSGYYEITENAIISHNSQSESNLHGYIVKELVDGHFFHYRVLNDSSSKEYSLYYQDVKNNTYKICEIGKIEPRFETSLVQHKDGSLSFSNGNKSIIRFRKDQLIDKREFHTNVIKLFNDSNDNLWIGTVDQGFFCARKGNFSFLDHFSNGSAAIVTETPNGGLWIKSNKFGFGYIAPISFQHYSVQSGYPELSEIFFFDSYGDSLLIKNEDGDLFVFYNDSITKFIPPGIDNLSGNEYWFSHPTTHHYNPITNEIWVSYLGSLQNWDGKNWSTIDFQEDIFNNEYTYNIVNTKKGEIIGQTKKEIYKVVENQLEILASHQANIRSIEIDENEKIWISGFDGIWVLDEDQFIRPYKNLPGSFYERGNEIINAFGRIWIYNIDDFLYMKNRDTFKKIHSLDGKPLKINHHSVSLDGTLWFYSSFYRKIYKIYENNGQLKVDRFELDDNIKLPNVHRSKFTIKNENIILGTNSGLFIEKIKNLERENEKPIAIFDEIKINKEIVPVKSNYNLNYEENNLTISFDAISYRGYEIVYRYKLKGIEPTWNETSFPTIQYTNLNPGNYDFMIQVGHPNGYWSEIKSISIFISKPFWETWWFIISAIIIGICLILFAVYLRINQIRKKEQEKSKIALELAKLEMRALKSQINPHFIFNSITSAMHYLVKNENNKARKYLQEFSILIRKILENSEENLVLISEEVSLMQTYVQLESEQFEGNPIQLKIEYKGLNPESDSIPPTLIQPYIENSIRHGLRSKAGERIIQLTFEKVKKSIQITIEDNGIGRKAAANLSQRNDHKSFGMLISLKRIEVLNKKENGGVKVKDLIDKNGDGIGTRITFMISIENMLLKTTSNT